MKRRALGRVVRRRGDLSVRHDDAVGTDFAPLLLVLMVGAVGAMTGMLGGFLATVSAVAMLIVASTMQRVEHLALYLSILGMGWLVGWLMHTQQQLTAQAAAGPSATRRACRRRRTPAYRP